MKPIIILILLPFLCLQSDVGSKEIVITDKSQWELQQEVQTLQYRLNNTIDLFAFRMNKLDSIKYRNENNAK